MLFNSIEFFIFLPIVLLLNYLMPQSKRWIILLGASYFFYAFWKLEYTSLLIFSTILDYYAAKYIDRSNVKRTRDVLLAISVVSNLGVLFFFKYSGFFVKELSQLLVINPTYYNFFSSILLPVGISFYTFQTMSYTIDVYRKDLKPAKNMGYFALYVAYFPQLVAGPIERAGHLLNQFYSPHVINRGDIYFGILRILIGLFKKVVIADRLSSVVDVIFANPLMFNGFDLVIGTVFFAIQIYCDFSGYSDIAIGVSRLFGIRLMENFKSPYFSKSLREFWSRWHISLSTWFRDYVYIPLGGNRGMKWRISYNLLITFVLSGFWHGAAWTFIIWGLIHGVGLVIQKAVKFPYIPLRSFLRILLTAIIVLIGWIFFRAESLSDALSILKKISDFSLFRMPKSDSQNLYYGEPLWRFGSMFILLVVLFIIDYISLFHKRLFSFMLHHPIYVWSFFAILTLSIIIFGVFKQNEFIYFQF